MADPTANTAEPGVEAVSGRAARAIALFEHMQEGAAFQELIYDAQGRPVDYRILDVNHQYELHTGLSRSEVVGRLASEVYNAETPPLLEEFARAESGGAPMRLEFHYAPLHRYFGVSVVPIGTRAVAAIFSDITQHKLESEQRALKQTALRALLDNLPFVAWYKDVNGRYLAVNRA